MAQRDEADAALTRGRPFGVGPPAFRPHDDRRVGRDLRSRRLDNDSACVAAPGSTSISIAAACGSSSQLSKVNGPRMSGTTARRDCLTDAIATRFHRSTRPPRTSAATVTSVRDVIIGWMAATPSITASRTMSSILSPLRTAWTSVSGTDASMAGSTRERTCTRTSRASALSTFARNSWPRPSKTRHRVARPQAQHARQMLGFVFGQNHRLVAGIKGRSKEPMHGGIITDSQPSTLKSQRLIRT